MYVFIYKNNTIKCGKRNKKKISSNNKKNSKNTQHG